MRVIIQRVGNAKVTVDNALINEIGFGLLLYVAFKKEDSTKEIEKISQKIVNLRLFENEKKFILDVKGEILSISQFTLSLYGNVSKGRRPSFSDAAKFDEAKKLYDHFNENLLEEYNVITKTGIFGADMVVDSQNIGPYTLILDSEELM